MSLSISLFRSNLWKTFNKSINNIIKLNSTCSTILIQKKHQESFPLATLKFSKILSCRNFSQKSSRQEIDYADLSALNRSDSSEDNKKKHKGKTPIIPKVYVRDENGRLLGLMTIPEAQKLAQKHKKILVETDGPAKKIPTMKFSDPRLQPKPVIVSELSQEENTEELESSEKTNKKKPPKVIAFTTKVSEHDLRVKINQVKKFLLRGQETLIRVSCPNTSDIQQLEQIFEEFEKVFNENNGVRINQKRIKDTDLKFNILVINLDLVKQKLSLDSNITDNNEFIDLNQIDPNKLLEDETIIDKIKNVKIDSNNNNNKEQK